MKSFAEKLEHAGRDYSALIEHITALTAEQQDGITRYEDAYERIQPDEEKEIEEEQARLRAENESNKNQKRILVRPE